MTANRRTIVVKYGNATVPVTVTLRAIKRLSISVHPDMSVTAIAPHDRPIDQIERRIRARAGWIIRQRREFAKYIPTPAPRRYVSGETHLYLGRQYRLRLRRTDAAKVVMQRGLLIVETPNPHDAANTRDLLRVWYRVKAKDVLSKRFEKCVEQLRSAAFRALTPVFLSMKKRWGSCTKKGRILLNPDLVKVPVQCIDYVIIHELCHLKVLKHDRRFYMMLGRHLPDWQQRKARLDQIVLPMAI